MRTTGRAGGFTLLEVLIVSFLVSILAGLAMPNLQRALLRARAAEAIGALRVVRVAALQYFGEHGEWPRDVGRGVVPSDLAAYVPEGFSFRRERWVMDWENWSGRRNGFVGVTVITDEEELGDAVLSLLGDRRTWTDGRTRFSWVIDWD